MAMNPGDSLGNDRYLNPGGRIDDAEIRINLVDDQQRLSRGADKARAQVESHMQKTKTRNSWHKLRNITSCCRVGIAASLASAFHVSWVSCASESSESDPACLPIAAFT